MSWMNRLEPPEAEFTDEEWDTARERLIADLVEVNDWTRDEAAEHVDDWLVIEQCEADREDRAATAADEELARRKENW